MSQAGSSLWDDSFPTGGQGRPATEMEAPPGLAPVQARRGLPPRSPIRLRSGGLARRATPPEDKRQLANMVGTLSHSDELLSFFKALADANRLKIVGVLAQQPSTVEQLAAMLNLQPSTVSHHLARLAEAGLVSARAESYYHVYRLETDALEQMARRLLARETLPAVAADVDLDAFDRKVLRDYAGPDGRLTALPTQRKKFMAVLRYALQLFRLNARYNEAQVNEILAQINEDTARLRRELVDLGWMARDHGVYWRVE